MKAAFEKLKVLAAERADSMEEYSDLLQELRDLVMAELTENNKHLIDRHPTPLPSGTYQDRVRYIITEYAPHLAPHTRGSTMRYRVDPPATIHANPPSLFLDKEIPDLLDHPSNQSFAQSMLHCRKNALQEILGHEVLLDHVARTWANQPGAFRRQ